MLQSMFHMQLPVLEKIARPVIVYIVLILLLRLFGKRELAQLNPFDLVVLLSLSNTVQNAMIGDDNSVSGGLVGAASLLAANWLLSKAIFRAPKLNKLLEGGRTTLISGGKVDEKALQQESMTMEELIGVLNKNNYNVPAEVEVCALEPNGTFFVKGIEPDQDSVGRQKMQDALEALSLEVKLMREEIAGRRRDQPGAPIADGAAG